MKITPQTESEFHALKTPRDVRRRMRELQDTNDNIKIVFAMADNNRLSELDRYTLLAFHLLVLLEARQ